MAELLYHCIPPQYCTRHFHKSKGTNDRCLAVKLRQLAAVPWSSRLYTEIKSFILQSSILYCDSSLMIDAKQKLIMSDHPREGVRNFRYLCMATMKGQVVKYE